RAQWHTALLLPFLLASITARRFNGGKCANSISPHPRCTMATRSLPCPSCQAVIEIDSGPQNESPPCPRGGRNGVPPVQTGDSSVVEIFPALTPTWRPDQPSPTPLGRHADGGHVVIHNHRQRHSVQGLKVTVIVATCVSGGIGLILTAVFGSR